MEPQENNSPEINPESNNKEPITIFGQKHSKTFIAIFVAIVELITLIAVYSLGVSVGFRKVSFTYSWAKNYPNNFGIPAKRFILLPPPDAPFFNAHGLDGEILSLSKNSLVIKDEDGNEKTILVLDSTFIRKDNQNLKFSDLKTNQQIVIIGAPNELGQIQAKFIRILN